MARYTRDSLEEVPGTNDLDNIKGALRPIALSNTELMNAENDSTDQNSESLDPVPIVKQEEEKKQDEEKTAPVMLRFRDGEHSGEASLAEIIEGHDDGELSDRCLIYDQASESWMAIGKFVDRENSANMQKEAEPVVSDSLEDVDISTPEVVSRDVPSIEIEPFEDIQHVSKNDRKKPKRDISAWGKGQVQPLTTKTEENENTERDASKSRRKKSKHTKPPPKLMRLCTQAMIQWDMLEDGDRLLLGLSGGKDSMSLLHVLLEFQKKLPIRFEIEVCTIDPMTPSFGK